MIALEQNYGESFFIFHSPFIFLYTSFHYLNQKKVYFPTVLLLMFYYSSHTLSPLYMYYYLYIIMSTSLISPESIPDESFISLNPEETIVVKRGGGRPKNIVWNYFKHNALKHPGHYDAKCKFCGTYWKNGIVKKLQVHLANKCENVDVKVKNKFMHYIATKDGIVNEN
jgi:hypothetical protein